jgi:pimeloyl-ACP methyl ester carboxylesterase
MNYLAMRVDRVTCPDANGQHTIVYSDWGNHDASSTVLCLHGLTRNRHDFDLLARYLMTDYRVICVDVVGRGDSDYLTDSKLYHYNTYVKDVLFLLQQLEINKVDLIGTSMGGLIGLHLAALANSPIKRLILNDIGPIVPQEALARIAGYIGQHRFPDLASISAHLRQRYASFGPLTESQWQHVIEHSIRHLPTGEYVLAYDPEIAQTFHSDKTANLWATWLAVKQPILLLHGAQSDVLPFPVVEQMQASRPDLSVVHIPNIGHSPMLMSSDQMEIVAHWLG